MCRPTTFYIIWYICTTVVCDGTRTAGRSHQNVRFWFLVLVILPANFSGSCRANLASRPATDCRARLLRDFLFSEGRSSENVQKLVSFTGCRTKTTPPATNRKSHTSCPQNCLKNWRANCLAENGEPFVPAPMFSRFAVCSRNFPPHARFLLQAVVHCIYHIDSEHACLYHISYRFRTCMSLSYII